MALFLCSPGSVNLRINDRRPMRASECGPGLERIYPSAFPNGRVFLILGR